VAEYIKFRLTAAKVGVSMALLGLIAGLAERAQAKPRIERHATASFTEKGHKLVPLTVVLSDLQRFDAGCAGNQSRQPEFNFTKKTALTCLLANGVYDVAWAVGKFNKALTNFEHEVDAKIYKLTSADAAFLKITDANTEFLKITDANAEYLKIDAANSQFLKVGATAANSSELGGLTPDAFFQGHGNVVTGAATISTDSQSRTLLALPGGIIVVSVAANADELTITVTNNTGALIPAVQDGDSTPITIAPGQSETLPAVVNNAQAHQIHLQLMPNSSFADVVTLMISSEPSPTGSGIEVVGQAFTGSV
jgi:hypothetical protein